MFTLNRSRTCSRMGNHLFTPNEKTFAPGVSMMFTPQFPNRPLGGVANPVVLNHAGAFAVRWVNWDWQSSHSNAACLSHRADSQTSKKPPTLAGGGAIRS